MRKLRHIINIIIWAIVSLYFIVVVLLHIPSIQVFVGNAISDALSEKLGTNVKVGRVDLGFLNRIIIDDLVIDDQLNKPMLEATRLSVKLDYAALASGKIHISSVQLFGLKASLYSQTAQSKPNFQFALDSLASKDTTTTTPLDLRINTLIIRRGNISYNQLDVPKLNTFSPKHISVNDISAHIALDALTNDSLNLNIKDLSFKEQSGLHVKSLTAELTANKRQAQLANLTVILPASTISFAPISASYAFDGSAIQAPSLQFNGKLERSQLTLSDLACFLPELKKSTKPFVVQADVNGTSTSVHIKTLEISSNENNFSLLANGSVSNWNAKLRWASTIQRLRVSAEGVQFLSDNFANHFKVPGIISRLGNIDFIGEVGGYGQDIATKGIIRTDAGMANMAFGKHNNNLSGRLETNGLDLGKILDDKRFGNISTQIDIDGKIPTNGSIYVKAKGNVKEFFYNTYSYNNIAVDGEWNNGTFDGKLSINDPNVMFDLQGQFNLASKQPFARLKAEVSGFKPAALGLSKRWPNTQIGFNLMADIKGNSLNTANGRVQLERFTMASDTKNYKIDNLSIDVSNNNQLHSLALNCDFGHVLLTGNYDYNTLTQSLTNLIASKVPTMPGLPKATNAHTNNFSISGNIDNTEWLQHIFNIPLNIEQPLNFAASMNDTQKTLDVSIKAPSITFNGHHIEGGDVNVRTLNDTLKVDAQATKVADNGKRIWCNVQASAADNNISTIVSFDNLRNPTLRGQLRWQTSFFNDDNGHATAQAMFLHSSITVGDAIWKVKPSLVTYSKNRLVFDNFAVSRDKQFIAIDGAATNNPQDSLTVDIKDVDVSYILNLVNFHAVEFGGRATGTAVVKTPFTNPDAYANIRVNDFTFEEGDMGTLVAGVRYNTDRGNIEIDAIANDGLNTNTFINGYVSPLRNSIDLSIKANNTNIAFMETFCKSFMHDVKAYANGEVRLYGLLSHINLTGQLVANGSFTMTPLNTTYTMINDTVRLVPDRIDLNACRFIDRNGNAGTIAGEIKHSGFTDINYNLNVKANNLLVYDTKSFGENTFYGTVYATGKCNINGHNGEVNIDVDATPNRNSTIVYNVASPQSVNSNSFIHWGADALLTAKEKQEQDGLNEDHLHHDENIPDIPTDIHINFLVNCTPDATIRLIMDKQSGDNISLNGNGVIRATYYNKGSFDMFGNYAIEHGVYKLTIQNVIKKDFTFERGSIIAFNGDPYAARLNMKAIYTANSVSLSDLNIGKSFSNNTIRVNCLMNITGTPEAPKVAFDLDLPTIDSNVKQMIYSFINGEEEMNQQVLYLLAVGRFYTQGQNNADLGNSNQQSKTSLAMQSFLSSTLSQQLNNVLGTVVNNTNWNFGANISTGDDGWGNAEYEGVLSGRLLNNRLLINGQFGYRDNVNTTQSFIGDFDIRYLLFPSGNLAIKMYNQSNDRYFTRNSLNTQGFGLILKKDFNGWKDLFGITNRKKKKTKVDKKK